MEAQNLSPEGAEHFSASLPPANFPLARKLLIAFFLFGCAPTVFTWVFFLVAYRRLTNLAQASLDPVASLQVAQVFRHDLQNAFFLLAVVLALMLVGIVVATRILLAPVAAMRHWLEAQHIKNFDNPDPVPPNLTDELGELWRDVGATVTHFDEIKGREREIAEQKSEFLMVVAHQLRTPLTEVRWGLESLLKESGGEAHTTIDRSLEACSNMSHLIDSFLSTSNLEEGKFGSGFADIDVRAVTEQVMADIKATAKNRDITLILDAPEGDHYRAWADQKTLILAISNLLDNAVNYSKKGAHVTVRLQSGDHQLNFTIEDTGIGMTPEEVRRLFVKFSRAAEAINLHPNGSGIGLYIARNVVLRHGSDITVESTKGKGSRFSFSLPRTQADLKHQRTSVEQLFSSF